MELAILHDQHMQKKVCALCMASIDMPYARITGAPALLGVSDHADYTSDIFTTFYIYICPACGLVQTDDVSSEEQYSCVHSHAVGGIWEAHRDALGAFIQECTADGVSIRTVLEIGPSVQPVAQKLGMQDARIIYIDMMKEAPFVLGSNETYLADKFPSDKCTERFDLIIASHVLEHAASLDVFMSHIKKQLTDTGIAVLSIPNFEKWLVDKFWNAITPEHICYPFISHLTYMADKLSLSIRFKFFKEHSVFFYCTRAKKKQEKVIESMSPLSKSTEIMNAWIQDINNKIAAFETVACDTSYEVVIAGASHLAQYVYLMSDVIRAKVCAIVDNAHEKHGKRLYGTDVMVHPYDVLGTYEAPVLIIPPSPYADEMEKQAKAINAMITVIN